MYYQEYTVKIEIRDRNMKVIRKKTEYYISLNGCSISKDEQEYTM